MIAAELLNVLACPVCKGALIASDPAHYLSCRTCQLKFPVRESIPVLLVDQAERTQDKEQ